MKNIFIFITFITYSLSSVASFSNLSNQSPTIVCSTKEDISGQNGVKKLEQQLIQVTGKMSCDEILKGKEALGSGSFDDSCKCIENGIKDNKISSRSSIEAQNLKIFLDSEKLKNQIMKSGYDLVNFRLEQEVQRIVKGASKRTASSCMSLGGIFKSLKNRHKNNKNKCGEKEIGSLADVLKEGIPKCKKNNSCSSDIIINFWDKALDKLASEKFDNMSIPKKDLQQAYLATMGIAVDKIIPLILKMNSIEDSGDSSVADQGYYYLDKVDDINKELDSLRKIIENDKLFDFLEINKNVGGSYNTNVYILLVDILKKVKKTNLPSDASENILRDAVEKVTLDHIAQKSQGYLTNKCPRIIENIEKVCKNLKDGTVKNLGLTINLGDKKTLSGLIKRYQMDHGSTLPMNRYLCRLSDENEAQFADLDTEHGLSEINVSVISDPFDLVEDDGTRLLSEDNRSILSIAKNEGGNYVEKLAQVVADQSTDGSKKSKKKGTRASVDMLISQSRDKNFVNKVLETPSYIASSKVSEVNEQNLSTIVYNESGSNRTYTQNTDNAEAFDYTKINDSNDLGSSERFWKNRNPVYPINNEGFSNNATVGKKVRGEDVLNGEILDLQKEIEQMQSQEKLKELEESITEDKKLAKDKHNIELDLMKKKMELLEAELKNVKRQKEIQRITRNNDHKSKGGFSSGGKTFEKKSHTQPPSYNSNQAGYQKKPANNTNASSFKTSTGSAPLTDNTSTQKHTAISSKLDNTPITTTRTLAIDSKLSGEFLTLKKAIDNSKATNKDIQPKLQELFKKYKEPFLSEEGYVVLSQKPDGKIEYKVIKKEIYEAQKKNLFANKKNKAIPGIKKKQETTKMRPRLSHDYLTEEIAKAKK